MASYLHMMVRLSKSGTRIYYYRCPKSGRTTRMPGQPGEPRFVDAYAKLRAVL